MAPTTAIQKLNKITRFLVVLFLLTVLYSFIWGSTLEGEVYYSSDEDGFGYLLPGDWVHDPIVSKDFSEITGSMSDPDLIREGWSAFYLWLIWLVMFCSSIFISILFSKFGFDIFRPYTTKQNSKSSAQIQ